MEGPRPGGLPKQYTEGTVLVHPKVDPGVSEEDLKALRALGYVE